jgi:hypothetical protein
MPGPISSGDLVLFSQSRTKPNFSSLSPEERDAYRRIHVGLESLGAAAVDALGGSQAFASKTTSGFSPQSGVRGSLPKDLWFAAYNRSNTDTFVGMPQVFAIASARGIEIGLAAAIHPSDFSQSGIRDRVRQAAPKIFAMFPAAGSAEAAAIGDNLRRTGAPWFFRRKTRLDPGTGDFAGLDAWLSFLRSEEGARWSGGSISRYLRPEDLDVPGIDLGALVREAAAAFAPIMRSVVPTGATSNGLERLPVEQDPQDLADDVVRPALEEFLATFNSVRSAGPLGYHSDLWALMDRLRHGLEAMPSVRAHPRVRASWSLGKGNWAEVPWIALMDERETNSTRQGIYAVLLFRRDLSGAYLTLIQGVAALVDEMGRRGARDELRRRATEMRALVPELAAAGFALDGSIDLRTAASLGSDYEHGTIAHKLYPAGAVPTDAEIAVDLEALLGGYQRVLAEAGREESDATRANYRDEKTRRTWLWTLGDGAEHWDELYEAGLMAIGWDDLGDLARFASREDLASALATIYGADASLTKDARTCQDFVSEVRQGDLVLVRRGLSVIVGQGVVAGEYKHDPTRPVLRNVRAVRWVARGEWAVPYPLPAFETLLDISDPAERVHDLLGLAGAGRRGEAPRPVPPGERKPFTLDNAMAGLFMPRAEFERALGVWRARRNLVLQGAPGVGKSFIARRLAYALMGYEDPSRVRTVQFHQSYAYEDFVQGFRPAGAGGGFALREGVFVEFCRRALAEPDEKWVFIIDEVNRGNLSKILGELMLLIEPDKRSPEWAVKLAYAERSNERFYVPPNVFLLGMMNTADRSLAVVDYALRRRFAFVTLSPAFGSEAFAAHLRAAGTSDVMIEKIRQGMERLNEEIAGDRTNLGPGFRIGHSFFASPSEPGEVGARETEDNWYERIIETEVVPLLAEYWFDDPEKAEDWRARLLG